MLWGFGNHHESEALPSALPVGQNSPQTCPYGLYAEQLSGSPFTMPRHQNQRSWLYRIRPSVTHPPFVKYTKNRRALEVDGLTSTPNQLRWDPFDVPSGSTELDFVDGLVKIAASGCPSTRHGLSIYIYACNSSMKNRAFYTSDGDMLIVPQKGNIVVRTEFGNIPIEPGHICVVQRGMKFAVDLDPISCPEAQGYILEVYDGHFELPDLGPIGSNGLANPQDFACPTARFDQDYDKVASYEIIAKYHSELWTCTQDHSPFDVVAWRGNYVPFAYDLARFNTMNTVSYDHADPSIFTVLTCRSAILGQAIADFVIFPPRWAVSEHTFRPPYFHRNCMSEYMGLIAGSYEAKGEGFRAGGGSLHSIMTPHGPDTEAFEKGTTADLVPVKVAQGTLAFMFESSLMLRPTTYALEKSKRLQHDYWTVWAGLKSKFDPTRI